MQEQKKNSEISGILNILKPPGMTSFDVVGYLRRMLKIKKIGHTGTLDPAAIGVLPVCIGQATKAIEYMMDKDKVYRAELALGKITDTQDSTGEILEQRDINISDGQLYAAFESFIGKYQQVPPMYSAVKIGGKKLYELAREGITVERNAREVEIYSLNIVHIKRDEKWMPIHVLFDVHCSKGTYIRTLCADIGEKLGCGGHMSFLIRSRTGNFGISEALTIEDIEQAVGTGQIVRRLISVENVFSHLDKVVLSNAEKKKFTNGVWIEAKGDLTQGSLIRVIDDHGKMIALGEIFENKGVLMLKSKKMFVG
ncbi:MAG: tRNA pseudouridine(55) synthase TruB [Clostridia bacterium]|nr:tRNA pseudouridine(55) synthase TruB [Clostridia bacterium]